MSRYLVFDRKPLLLASAVVRHSDLVADRVAPLQASVLGSFSPEMNAVVAAISSARQARHPIVLMIGGHPIKLGLSGFLFDLIEKGFISCLATNGAGLIHDFELALMGETSEDVAMRAQTVSRGHKRCQEPNPPIGLNDLSDYSRFEIESEYTC